MSSYFSKYFLDCPDVFEIYRICSGNDAVMHRKRMPLASVPSNAHRRSLLSRSLLAQASGVLFAWDAPLRLP